MRWFLLLLSLVGPGASAAPRTCKTRDYGKSLDQANRRFLLELSQLVEAQGYRGVQIVPQLFVATARGKDGEPYTLIINSDTLQVLRFEGKLPLAGKTVPETRLPGLH
jgi:hypothetical protein